MLNEFELRQEVISNNKEIFETLHAELKKASQEVLVATSWFTDDVLFNELLELTARGIKVDLIIADNIENQKLNFQALSDAGASVLRIKNVGYGMMHQKFCVIDRKLIFHGTYNWTNNAKNNNHESVIVTNHEKTVERLITTFFDIKKRAIDILEGREPEPIENSRMKLQDNTQESIIDQIKTDEVEYFAMSLEALIAAETNTFNRDVLKKEGYDRAKATNGDAQILNTELDSIYSVFVHDINLADEKKQSLIVKVEEAKAKSISLLKQKQQTASNSIESESLANTEAIKLKCTNAKTNIELSNNDIAGVKKISIPENEKQIEALNVQITKLKQDFVRPPWKHFQLWPTIIAVIFLGAYIFFFYSSAGYILLFSETEAMEAEKAGIEQVPPQVYNPKALSQLMDMPGNGFIYVCLMVSIPFGLCLLSLFIKREKMRHVFTAIGFLAIDVFVAMKVTETIHQIRLLRGDTKEPFKLLSVFTDLDFYLVFVIGGLGLLLFKLAFEKLISLFEERNIDINEKKAQLSIEQIDGQIKKLTDARIIFDHSILDLEKKIVTQRGEIELMEIDILSHPHKKNMALEKIKSVTDEQTQRIERVTDLYKSHIENNRIPIHIDSIKDRINVYLQGWNDLLHDEYSIPKAIEKSKSAMSVAYSWQQAKLVKENIDKRIGIY